MPTHTISPTFQQTSKILILGSFPSVKSREIGYYYGHPQNRFWRVLPAVFGDTTEKLINADIHSKQQFLYGHKIALWDVIASCDIKGSSDASIENVVPNDISYLLSHSNIQIIYCNGTTAYQFFEKYIKKDLLSYCRENHRPTAICNAICLPSTSPANAAWSLDGLINAWRRILTGLHRSDFSQPYYSLNQFAADQALFAADQALPQSMDDSSPNETDIFQSKIKFKLYKLSLDGGFTCPNRDGNLDTRGCIFCDGGSGDFAGSRMLPIKEQLKKQKELIKDKLPKNCQILYIAYFQSYTGTYDSVERLRQLYKEAISDPEVAVLSIATRPDCLQPEILNLLSEINQIKPVWIELGLQTIHKSTAEYIRRGYDLKVYNKAVSDLQKIGIEQIITHIILGLPGESPKMLLKTISHVVKIGSTGIKLQLLHVIRGTDLEQDYKNKKFDVLTLEEYTELLKQCIDLLPPDLVVHRLTGDGNKRTLIAPLWSADKKRVLNYLLTHVAIAVKGNAIG